MGGSYLSVVGERGREKGASVGEMGRAQERKREREKREFGRAGREEKKSGPERWIGLG